MSVEVDSPLVEPPNTWMKPRVILDRVREGVGVIAPGIASGQVIQKGKKHVTESLLFIYLFIFLKLSLFFLV